MQEWQNGRDVVRTQNAAASTTSSVVGGRCQEKRSRDDY